MRALAQGDVIRIVAPSGPLLDLDINPLIRLLEGAGYEIQLGRNLHGQWRYLAGSDQDRASDLMDAFTDTTVDAVFCARGGYGLGRLLPLLDLDLIAASRKPFVGFSDITALHLALNRRGMRTLHAPMAYTFANEHEPWVAKSLLGALSGIPTIPSEAPTGTSVIPGIVEGVVVGGCLTLLADACGTAEQPRFGGKIVLIEDVGERAYRVDARLTQLLGSGVLQSAAAFVIGEMTGTNGKEPDQRLEISWQEVITERLGPLGKPMIFGYPFGHITNPLTLPLGIRARLDAGSGTLHYLENLCD